MYRIQNELVNGRTEINQMTSNLNNVWLILALSYTQRFPYMNFACYLLLIHLVIIGIKVPINWNRRHIHMNCLRLLKIYLSFDANAPFQIHSLPSLPGSANVRIGRIWHRRQISNKETDTQNIITKS